MSDHVSAIDSNVPTASSPSALRITDMRVAEIEEIGVSENRQ